MNLDFALCVFFVGGGLVCLVAGFFLGILFATTPGRQDVKPITPNRVEPCDDYDDIIKREG